MIAAAVAEPALVEGQFVQALFVEYVTPAAQDELVWLAAITPLYRMMADAESASDTLLAGTSTMASDITGAPLYAEGSTGLYAPLAYQTAAPVIRA
jgi:hypothetical protein